jgi:glycosyltransferase involved in cell wall biosynthesis
MSTVCLNMIVKDEAHVIERCLKSVMPFINTWCIVDTGSKDGTQDKILEVMKDIPGELHERGWRDFGYNRTEAIKLAEDKAEYLLFIDADEQLIIPEGWEKPGLVQDAYHLLRRLDHIEYPREGLVATRLKWSYNGAIQEHLVYPPEASPAVMLEGPTILVTQDGARSKDPMKIFKDISVLKSSLYDNPDSARDVFYLAQALKGVNDVDGAIKNYEKRIVMGGWHEEIGYSMLMLANLYPKANRPYDECAKMWMETYQFNPTRAETAGMMARYFRTNGKHNLAFVFAKTAIDTVKGKDQLFVDTSWEAWQDLDEYALACYYTGRFAESKSVCEKLLEGGKLPENEVARVMDNLVWAQRGLES